ncbi:MAG: AMP-binding protein [Candidatus Thiodiazotropha sp. (ex Dulcina madagascariensis)]|nr:AMP-binding protein [Candidatus Thiodiazotropha sp. (ex Dulcina madagascariensis)]
MEANSDISAILLQTVRELAAEIRPGQISSQAITLDSALARDLGLDSLGRVELLSRIEQRFEISIPEQLFAEVETPRDLLRAVLSAGAAGKSFALSETSEINLGEAEAAPHSVQTLAELLHWHVLAHPHRPHICLYRDDDEGETLTYLQLWEGAEQIAVGLQQRGLQAGETVAIMLPTGKAYFFSFFGILLAGGIPVPIYPPVRRSQIEEHLRRHGGILSNCLAIMLITVPEARHVVRLLKSQVDTLRSIVTVEELSSETGELTIPVRRAQDIAFLQYTSGSTGNPKGVVLTHANLLTNIRVMGAAMRVDSSDVFVSWLPLYHDMGLIGTWLGSLYYAALFVVMSPLAFLSRPQRWLWAIHRYDGTLSAAPNFGYELCLRRISDADLEGLNLASWRAAFNGAEAVSPETMLNFHKRFGPYGLRGESLMPVYGLAEASVGLAFPPLGRGIVIDRIQREPFMRSGRAIPAEAADAKAQHFVASGQPLAGHQIRIIDQTGHELPDRQEGQLQFRGPSATSGYFRNPEETGRLFDGEWLNSGDLAYMVGGDVYITGRSKDIIIRAGRNIYPDELEEAVGNIPGIRKGRVAVFASSDPASGTERLVLMAETRQQAAESLEQLRLQIHMIATDLVETAPDEVVLAPPNTVLKTSSGKIRRAASREVYEGGRVGKRQKSFAWQLTRLALAGIGPQLRRTRQTLSVIFYGLYARMLFWIHAPVVWLAAAILPRISWRWAAIRAGARLLAWASGTPLRVQGLEHLPPAGQPCVFVANHASYLDGPVLVAALTRPFSFVAKAELLQRLIPRVFLHRIQAEFVERFDQQKGIADAHRLAKAARQGQSLLFFPEGTFTRMSGLLPFHMGAFVAAAEASLPVVPITIRGTRSILRSGAWFPHHGAITVNFGQPIYPETVTEETTESDWAIAVKLRNASRQDILRHCGETDLAHEEPSI